MSNAKYKIRQKTGQVSQGYVSPHFKEENQIIDEQAELIQNLETKKEDNEQQILNYLDTLLQDDDSIGVENAGCEEQPANLP